MTTHFHGLHDIIVHPLVSLRLVLFVQTLVFCSVFCDPFFVLLFFGVVCYSKTNDCFCNVQEKQPMVLFPEYLSSHRYLLGLVMCDLGFLCSVLQIIVCHFVRFLYCHCIVCPSYIYPQAIFTLFLDIQISGIGNFGNNTQHLCVHPDLYLVRVAQFFAFCVVFCRSLFLLLSFPSDYCIECSTQTYDF